MVRLHRQAVSTAHAEAHVMMGVRLPARLHHRMKLHALTKRLTMQEVVEAAFTAYLKRHGRRRA